MTLRPSRLSNNGISTERDPDYSCPHCGRQQVISGLTWDFTSGDVSVKQCLSCAEISIDGLIVRYNPSGSDQTSRYSFYPGRMPRPALHFEHTPAEVVTAYQEACRLFGLHVGAAGAYARRALELILDHAGYAKPVLAASIELAAKEEDGEKRLPKRLLTKLDYVKEIGNFAVHVRRDGELSIVEIDGDEVEACLEIIEELVAFMFEEPGRDRVRTEALNAKLKAAGKKEIALPPLSGRIAISPADEA
ncbi:MAG: DUF4145 domain-containing protein [Brevundimonas sp.]